MQIGIGAAIDLMANIREDKGAAKCNGGNRRGGVLLHVSYDCVRQLGLLLDVAMLDGYASGIWQIIRHN